MVVPEEVSNDVELHVELRNKFLEELRKNGNYDDFEESDIERIKNDDAYCKRFILHKKGNFNNALEMVDEALKWRKSFGVKSVTQESIPPEFFQAKAVFPFNKDKEGNPIILILVRYHRKIPEFIQELRRFVIYWVELMEEQTNGGHMTVIMSCTGAGLSNLDLDLIKFLITLFRSYYPDSLAHILIYEMPWLFNAAWKIIKAWLPEDFVEKIKFVNRTSIQDYVNEDSLIVEMGGTDTQEYEPPSFANDINSNTIIETEAGEPKRVHFSQKVSNGNRMPNGLTNGHRLNRSGSSDDSTHVLITDDFAIIGGILKICPAMELVFSPSEDSSDVVIKLSCVSKTAISYKVKTNNINCYRVKPSYGLLEPGSSIEISVVLLTGFHPQPSDKFLIMAMEVPDPSFSVQNLSSFWKSASSDAIADHKLRCVLKEPETPETEMEKTFKNIKSSLESLEMRMQVLDSRQASIQFRQTISLYLLIFLSLLFVLRVVCPESILFPSFAKGL